MKNLFILLFFPFASLAQTIHTEDDRISYKGTIVLAGKSPSSAFSWLHQAVQTAAQKSKTKSDIQTTDNKLTVQGEMKLNTPFHLVRTLQFTLQVTPAAGGYEYRLDSVFVAEKRRGGSTKVKRSKELLEGMEETGTVAIATERLLNEIDLRLQKFLTMMESAAKAGEK